jgi:hypothetical protein
MVMKEHSTSVYWAIPHLTFSLAASCCRRCCFPSRTLFEVDPGLDNYCSSHPTSDEKGRPPSHRLAPTGKKGVACRVAAVQVWCGVWTREWDDDPPY